MVSKYPYIQGIKKKKIFSQRYIWRKIRQSQDPIRSFNSAASNRVVTKSIGLIYKGFGLQATTLPFPRRDSPTKSQCTAVPRKGFAFTYATVQFPRDVSISVGRRAPFRCIQFHETPFILPPFRDAYHQILLFSIRWWINPLLPKTIVLSTIVVYTFSSEA